MIEFYCSFTASFFLSVALEDPVKETMRKEIGGDKGLKLKTVPGEEDQKWPEKSISSMVFLLNLLIL